MKWISQTFEAHPCWGIRVSSIVLMLSVLKWLQIYTLNCGYSHHPEDEDLISTCDTYSGYTQIQDFTITQRLLPLGFIEKMWEKEGRHLYESSKFGPLYWNPSVGNSRFLIPNCCWMSMLHSDNSWQDKFRKLEKTKHFLILHL